MKIDIGCGKKCKPGFEGVDRKNYGQKHIFNLEKPWLLKDNSIDEIHCSHCLEHIKYINHFMLELYRVLKPSGKATIIVPIASHEFAFRDPSHVRFFTENTFYYFNKDYAEEVDYDMEYDFDFDVKVLKTEKEVVTCLKPRK